MPTETVRYILWLLLWCQLSRTVSSSACVSLRNGLLIHVQPHLLGCRQATVLLHIVIGYLSPCFLFVYFLLTWTFGSYNLSRYSCDANVLLQFLRFLYVPLKFGLVNKVLWRWPRCEYFFLLQELHVLFHIAICHLVLWTWNLRCDVLIVHHAELQCRLYAIFHWFDY